MAKLIGQRQLDAKIDSQRTDCLSPKDLTVYGLQLSAHLMKGPSFWASFTVSHWHQLGVHGVVGALTGMTGERVHARARRVEVMPLFSSSCIQELPLNVI